MSDTTTILRIAAQSATVKGTHFECCDCHQVKPMQSSGGTGYAVTDNDLLVCYDCCAIRDTDRMKRDGRATLYLVKEQAGWFVTNWPGTLQFPAYDVRRFRHPFADARIAYFHGPDGKRWSAKNIGDQQIAHCRALKS